MSEHADVEALSAYVDGEAPEWAGHVAGCATCRAAADRLRTVAAAVGAPVPPPNAARRDAAIHAALGATNAQRPAERGRLARRSAEGRWALAGIAAVLLVALGFAGAILSGTRTADDATTVAGPALESAPTAGALGERQADMSAAVPPTDLGDVPDAATLVARARPALTATTPAPSGTGASAPGPAPAPAPAAAGGQRAAVPDVAGTRPCEEQARARNPSLREVVYYATARRGSTPAVVLGFSTGPAPAPVTLLLLAQEGCSELLRASAGP